MAEIKCKSKGAALSALDFLATITPPGIQRSTLLAVKEWVSKNSNNGNIISEERLKYLRDIFEGKDERKKAV
jgi:hypothetical protein